MHQNPAKHRLVVLALPDVVAFDLTIPTQVLGHDVHDRYDLKLASVRAGSVSTTSGFEISGASGLEALDNADTVIVPGFDGPVPPSVREALVAAHERGARVASICTGAFALAAAGLLDGRRATTHWKYAADLARRHPMVTVDPSVLYVDDGDVLTSAGLAAGLDVCLHLMALDFGEAAATERARHMVTPVHRAGGQAQFIPSAPGPRTPAGSDLEAVTEWARDHLHLPITVDDLARRALLAPRTFARAFTDQLGLSPHAWLTAQRLRAAATLLEDGETTIDEVARRCGLGSAANLRLHFRRAYATTPTAYRAAFAG